MATRVYVPGGEYVTEDEDGNEVERNSYWIEVSSSLMNEVAGSAIEHDQSPREMIGDILSGDVSLAEEPLDEIEQPDETDSDD